MNQKNIKYLYIYSCAIFTVIATIIFFVSLSQEKEFVVKPFEEKEYRVIDNVIASSAIIYDVDSKEIIAGKNIDIPRSIASITKLSAALLAYPKISEDDTTELISSDFDLFGNSNLSVGDKWKTKELLEYSLITSSNRGISAVARTIEEKTGISLVELMNNFVKENSLVHTHFINSTGLDAHNNLSGSESSAIDVAKISGLIIKTQSSLAKHTSKPSDVFYSLDGRRYDANNTNILLNDIRENVLLSKTGYTDIAGGALIMILEKDNRNIAFVVLDSTRSGRFEDMKKLFAFYERIKGDSTAR